MAPSQAATATTPLTLLQPSRHQKGSAPRICGLTPRETIRRRHDAEPASPHHVPAEFPPSRRIERSSSRALSALTETSRSADPEKQQDLPRIACGYAPG